MDKNWISIAFTILVLYFTYRQGKDGADSKLSVTFICIADMQCHNRYSFMMSRNAPAFSEQKHLKGFNPASF